MTTNFYDKVAKKFGSYHTPHHHTTEFPNGDPEKVFKDKLLELSDENKTALDVGCADGRFTLSMAPHFQKIFAIDLSQEMLKAAKKFQQEQSVQNVSFEQQDASHTTYSDNSIDVIYNRRGPSPYTEYQRLLKPNAFYLEIEIGEKDCMDIKKIFGRGQNYGKWDISQLETDKKLLENSNFHVIFSQDYSYDEYYPSFQELDLFLQGVPIFEDFDSEKDKQLLKDYVAKFTSEKGIRFPRQRVVLVAQKIKLE